MKTLHFAIIAAFTFVMVLIAPLGAVHATSLPVHKVALQPSGDFIQYETPCQAPGQHVQACIIVHKFVSGAQPVALSEISPSDGKGWNGRYKTYSVLYVYHLKPSGLNDAISVCVMRGKHTLMLDLSVGHTATAWLTTMDGGKTWSTPQTANMAEAMAN